MNKEKLTTLRDLLFQDLELNNEKSKKIVEMIKTITKELENDN